MPPARIMRPDSRCTRARRGPTAFEGEIPTIPLNSGGNGAGLPRLAGKILRRYSVGGRGHMERQLASHARGAGVRASLLRWLVVLSALLVAAGCGRLPPGPYEIHAIENDHATSVRRAFGKKLPQDVIVLNSVYFEYPANSSSGDWMFELLVTPEWIEALKRERYLRARETWPTESRLGKSRYEWFAIADTSEYDSFDQQATSLPYVQLHVKRTPEPDGRHHVFVSKW